MQLTRAYGALKELFALIGFAAVAAGVLLAAQRDDVLDTLAAALREPITAASAASGAAIEVAAAAMRPAVMVQPAAPVQPSVAGSVQDEEQQEVTKFIARRYRVSERAVASFVATAYRAGEQHEVDPLLILAVMAVESRYNPVAKSLMGAKGLMQVIPKWHPEKLDDHGGEEALLEPEVNILVGTQILREYMRRFGELERALQMYAGAFDEPTARYTNKVLAEKARLEVFRKKARKQQSA
jgi:soluble lytic murein transglycosylase-like protein